MNFTESREQRDFAASLPACSPRPTCPPSSAPGPPGDYASGRKLWARIADSGVTALGHARGARRVRRPPGRPGDRVRGPRPVRGSRPVGRVGGRAARAAGRDTRGRPAVGDRRGRGPRDRLDAAARAVRPRRRRRPTRSSCVDGGRLSTATVQHGAPVGGPGPSAGRRSRHATSIASVDAQRAFDLGALATAAQILGAGQAVLELSTDLRRRSASSSAVRSAGSRRSSTCSPTRSSGSTWPGRSCSARPWHSPTTPGRRARRVGGEGRLHRRRVPVGAHGAAGARRDRLHRASTTWRCG